MSKILIDEAVVRQAIKGLERSESALHKARAELNQALRQALEQPVLSDIKQAIIVEASIQMTEHPSKDARWFAESVYEYLMAEQTAPAQEPVATVIQFDGEKIIDASMELFDKYPIGTELYTTPPAPYDQTELELCDECGWKTLIPESGCLNCERSKTKKPLTNDVISSLWLWSQSEQAKATGKGQQYAFARAIEAAHGIGEQK
jgi:hypothetical protein